LAEKARSLLLVFGHAHAAVVARAQSAGTLQARRRTCVGREGLPLCGGGRAGSSSFRLSFEAHSWRMRALDGEGPAPSP
jgi:hypothetical protein